MANAQRHAAPLTLTSTVVVRRILAVLAGTTLVSVAAQVSVPVPFTPVPWTLQPMAVLIVGGLLGPRLGATSLALYLAIGATGLPVFAAGGGALGVARLVGPTGGYLLAYPLVAYVVGAVSTGGSAVRPTFGRSALACVAGLAVIHLGGVAMLTVIHGEWSVAARLGSVPFLLGDVVKILIAATVIHAGTRPIRSRL